MKLLLLAVGKLRPPLREVCDDYLRRLGRTVAIEEREVREAARAANESSRRVEEDRRLLKHLPDGMEVTLLDPTGVPWSSEDVARELEKWQFEARDRAVVIGGAQGVGSTMRNRANQMWSLGPAILPHELARIVTIEQLYRAATILRGEPYHRGGQ